MSLFQHREHQRSAQRDRGTGASPWDSDVHQLTTSAGSFYPEPLEPPANGQARDRTSDDKILRNQSECIVDDRAKSTSGPPLSSKFPTLRPFLPCKSRHPDESPPFDPGLLLTPIIAPEYEPQTTPTLFRIASLKYSGNSSSRQPFLPILLKTDVCHNFPSLTLELSPCVRSCSN